MVFRLCQMPQTPKATWYVHHITRRSITDRDIVIITMGPGPPARTAQRWPYLISTDTMIDTISSGLLGVGDYYSPPLSSDSDGSNLWLVLLEE